MCNTFKIVTEVGWLVRDQVKGEGLQRKGNRMLCYERTKEIRKGGLNGQLEGRVEDRSNT